MQMFQKGSPLARDVSKAILYLSENAELKRLEEKWLINTQDCYNNVTSSNDTDSLNLGSLWILYVTSCATSTICLLISIIQRLKSNGTPSDERVWNKVLTFAKQIYSKKLDNSSKEQDVIDCSSRSGHVSIADSPQHSQEFASPPKEVHMTSSSVHHMT
jgi:ionotropic glutamate receptor